MFSVMEVIGVYYLGELGKEIDILKGVRWVLCGLRNGVVGWFVGYGFGLG